MNLHPWLCSAPLHLPSYLWPQWRGNLVAEETIIWQGGWSVSSSLVWSSGLFSSQQCCCIPGSSWLPPALVSGRWKPCTPTFAIQSPPTVAVVAHLATGMFHLGWYLLSGIPLIKESELHSQQVRTRTKVESSTKTEAETAIECLVFLLERWKISTCGPLSPEEVRWSLPNSS